MKIRIGAATIVTLVMALAIGGYGIYQQRRAAAQPPMVERVVQVTTPHGIAPTPEFLIRHQTELKLRDTQVKHIHTIAMAYRQDIAPYQKRLTVVAAKYRQHMERSKMQDRLSMQELQNAGSDVQQLSGVVATARHAYWQQARTVLSVQQRTQADQLVSQATLRDLQ